eukprot:2341512-Pyramimonas_sp.AAC.1
MTLGQARLLPQRRGGHLEAYQILRGAPLTAFKSPPIDAQGQGCHSSERAPREPDEGPAGPDA